jgi:hypothetical protein
VHILTVLPIIGHLHYSLPYPHPCLSSPSFYPFPAPPIPLHLAQSQRALAPFLAGSIPHIRDPAVQDWTRDVMAERKELYAERGEQSIEWQDAKLEEGKEPVVGSRVVKID